ncbi:MAG TPA: helix-turn-helix transcriptional regulator [Pseudonocardiaceae bacterium]|jgi:predicted transcriptional regulator|nr:helix-turn-helix transcriptional regulator [Pseudonocardiaceae bacterium]
MSTEYVKWADVKATRREVDPRSEVERALGEEVARERHEAYLRGHQLAEMRKTTGVTQTVLAEHMGVSQARISKIEHGEVSGIDIVRAYVLALGGTIDLVATVGDQSWKVA